MVDLSTDYDGHDRAHQLVGALYRERTGIDLLTGERGLLVNSANPVDPFQPTQPAQPPSPSNPQAGYAADPTTGAAGIVATHGRRRRGVESGAGKKAGRKARGGKVDAQEGPDQYEDDAGVEHESEVEPETDFARDAGEAGHSKVCANPNRRGEDGNETSDDDNKDDLPIVLTRSQSKAGAPRSGSRPKPMQIPKPNVTTTTTASTSERGHQRLASSRTTVSSGTVKLIPKRRAVPSPRPSATPDPKEASFEQPTSLSPKPHPLRRSPRVRNNSIVPRLPGVTGDGDADKTGDVDENRDGHGENVDRAAPRRQEQMQMPSAVSHAQVGRPAFANSIVKPTPPRRPATRVSTGVAAATIAGPDALLTAGPSPTLPVRLSIALNDPDNPLSAPLVTSLSAVCTLPQLITVITASFRREIRALGGMRSLVAQGCYAAMGLGKVARWSDVGTEDRYVEWVGAVAEMGRLQGLGSGVVVLVVGREEDVGDEEGRGDVAGGRRGGGSGGRDGGRDRSGERDGNGGDEKPEDGWGEDKLPLSRPTKPPSSRHSRANGQKTLLSSKRSAKTRAHAAPESHSPSSAVINQPRPGKAPSATPSQRPQRLSTLFSAIQQIPSPRTQESSAFKFTESEEETDEEEMIEVPREYLERLELGLSRRGGKTHKGEDLDDERVADQRFWKPQDGA